MARNTEYKFVDTDTEAIITNMVSVYEAITGTTVQPGSPENLFIRWVANIIVLERGHINQAGNSNIPSRAEGQDLDALGETIFGLKRPAARPATITMEFNISAAQSFPVLIPAGTRVTDSGRTIYFDVDEDTYIPAGDTSITVSCTCETPGTAGNGYAAGQIDTLVDVFSYYQDCANTTMSGNGSDAATDEEYYDLMRQVMNSWSTAGAKGGYIFWAKSVSTDIADVVVKQPEPGYVYIYALMNDGTIAGSQTKAAILAACSADSVRPLTDNVSVQDPDTVSYSIEFTYYWASNVGKSAVQMAADVNAAVAEYVAWQQGKLGRDINPDKLREFLYAAGVKRVSIVSPTFTVLASGTSEDYTDPEIAQLSGTPTITDGGYEDE